MAERLDSSEEEVEGGFNQGIIQPYMFEPEFDEEELETLDMNEHEEESAAVAAEVERPNRVGNTDWCSCMTCGPMPSARESLCCQEMEVLTDKRAEADGPCITSHAEFQQFTARVVLENTLMLLMHVRNNPVHITNRGIRWAAYRQWTAWVYGKLGWKIRQPIPSCVVSKLRQLFPITPDEDADYVGFHEADSD